MIQNNLNMCFCCDAPLAMQYDVPLLYGVNLVKRQILAKSSYMCTTKVVHYKVGPYQL